MLSCVDQPNDAPRMQVLYPRHVKPTFCRLDVGEVGHPLLVWAVDLELSVQPVFGHRASSASVLGQSMLLASGAKCLFAHEPSYQVQTTSQVLFQHVAPHTACAGRAVAVH